jgi:hypothetical protein
MSSTDEGAEVAATTTTAEDAMNSWFTGKTQPNHYHHEEGMAIAISVIASLIGISVLVWMMWRIGRTLIRRRGSRRRERRSKDEMYFYLQKFDVDDIDLRRAPTGGWHGTYMRKLAYGVNDYDDDDCEKKDDDGDDDTETVFLEEDDVVDLEIASPTPCDELASSSHHRRATRAAAVASSVRNSKKKNKIVGNETAVIGASESDYDTNNHATTTTTTTSTYSFRRKSNLLTDVTESMPYYGLTKSDHDDDKYNRYNYDEDNETFEHRPWRKLSRSSLEDTI